MVTVQNWSGKEARLLRAAMRMSIRDFAAHLGVSDRVISKWEAGGEGYCPRPDSQAVLDTALARSTDETRVRFAEALGRPTAAAPGTGRIRVDSHKFLPVFIGAEQARRLRAEMGERSADSWLESSSARLEHSDKRTTCTLLVYACGVAVFHLVQPQVPDSLTDLAVWRYRSYVTDLPWAGATLRDLLGWDPGAQLHPEYVLSLYWVTSGPWAVGAEFDTALRLLSTPSVLVDRGAATGPSPLHQSVEESLLTTGFDHPDIVSFGVRGVSTGCSRLVRSGLRRSLARAQPHHRRTHRLRTHSPDPVVLLPPDPEARRRRRGPLDPRRLRLALPSRRLFPSHDGPRPGDSAACPDARGHHEDKRTRRTAASRAGRPPGQRRLTTGDTAHGHRPRGPDRHRHTERLHQPPRSRHAIPVISGLVGRWSAAGLPVVFTRYHNYPDSPFERFFGWTRLQHSPETDIVPELAEYAAASNAVLDKFGYSLFTEEATELIREAGWTDLVFCGIATESCVLKSAADAFERGHTPGSSRTPRPATPAPPSTTRASS